MEHAKEEEEETIWKTTNSSNYMVSATIGRVMNNLLPCRPKKLDYTISHLSSSPKSSSLDSLDGSLWCLHNYVRDAAGTNESLDQILVPMIEHTLTYKESKHNGQALILLNWLFQDELLFQALATNIAGIILRKNDRFISLGWCILVRHILDYEALMNHYLKNGIRENYKVLLKALCASIPHLSTIVCGGSTLQGGFELPTRLSVAAADCILALSEALTTKISIRELEPSTEMPGPPQSPSPKALNHPTTLIQATSSEKKVKPSSRFPKESNSMEMELLLWDQLDYLITLVQKLFAWSKKSRGLHATGLTKVLKWMTELKCLSGNFQDEAESKRIKTGLLLLSSCWRHYAILLHLEDSKSSQQFKELLDQYIAGIQYYTNSQREKHTGDEDSAIETRKFFLNCLCLLLGRLNPKNFESTMADYGLQISQVLLYQLHVADEDVIEGAVSILKAVIFKIAPSSDCSLADTRQLDAVLPLLLHLLDEQDGTAKAAVMLIAEYCSINTNSQCIDEVLKRTVSGELVQRMNALEVISKLILISPNSVNSLSQLTWKEIANHLLQCIEDEKLLIRDKASAMLPVMDPSLVLPALLYLVGASDERVQLSARDVVVKVLQHHSEKFEVISMLLDCLTNLSQDKHVTEATVNTADGSKLDVDQVLKLVPEWSKTVLDWSVLVGPLIDKMFAEPSNAIIVRFLSCISDHLAEVADIVLHRVLLHMKGKKDGDESFTCWDRGTSADDDSVKLQHTLFDHLCPLLVIRLLPLRVFNDLESSLMYGQSLLPIMQGNEENNVDDECVAGQLLIRAFGKTEFEDVRKLAAELCGRIHPQVLDPVISSILEDAADSIDTLKIKACLFSLCTSLVVRGRDSTQDPAMLRIRKTIETVLLWPSLDEAEVLKAQHGCIDCLALMICAELKAVKSRKYSTSNKNNLGDSTTNNSILTYVISQLTQQNYKIGFSSGSDFENSVLEGLAPVPYHLCMANVLISVCQKIDIGKKSFARKTIPRLLHAVKVITEAEIRAACIQVIFSAVYHLKSTLIPYASDLLKFSLESLKQESDKEKLAGAKLLASLMASEDLMVQSMSSGLLEARSLLSIISSSDPSAELRQICKKLLACITPS